MTRGTVTEEMFHWVYMKTWWEQVRDEQVAEDLRLTQGARVVKRAGPSKKVTVMQSQVTQA